MADSVGANAICSSSSDAPSAVSAPISKRHRWLQFSLFHLFVLTTIVAVLLAAIVVPAWRQRDAKARLQDLGVHLAFGLDPAKGAWSNFWSETIGKLTGDQRHNQLIDAYFPMLALGEFAVIDAALDQLQRLPRVNGLEICSDAVRSRHLRRISHLHTLRRLRVSGSQLIDDDLRPLAALSNLLHLEIEGPITGDGLSHLVGLKNLVSLTIRGPICDDSLAQLVPLKRLRILVVEAPLTDDALSHISRLTNLEELDLRSTNIMDAGMTQLMPLVRLKYLNCLHQHQPSWLLEKLRMRNLLSTIDLPFQIAMESLGLFYGFAWRIDLPALAEAGIDPDYVRLKVEPQHPTLGESLRIALAPHGLAWRCVDDTLVITSQAADEATHAGINQLRAALPNLSDVEVDW